MFRGEGFGSIWDKDVISLEQWQKLLSDCSTEGKIICLHTTSYGASLIGIFLDKQVARSQGYESLSEKKLKKITEEKK